MQLRITDMRIGEEGIVLEVQGGRGLTRKLELLGIRKGNRIKKLSSQFMRGPIVLEVTGSQIAVGFGMANKVIVEVERHQRTEDRRQKTGNR